MKRKGFCTTKKLRSSAASHSCFAFARILCFGQPEEFRRKLEAEFQQEGHFPNYQASSGKHKYICKFLHAL